MEDDQKNASLDSLFGKLHSLMVNLVHDVDSVIEDNKEVGMESIRGAAGSHKLQAEQEGRDTGQRKAAEGAESVLRGQGRP